MDYQSARDWYLNGASLLHRAGVRTRLFNAYPGVEDCEAAFAMAVRDELAGEPLPPAINS